MLCFLDNKFSTLYHIGLRDIMYVPYMCLCRYVWVCVCVCDVCFSWTSRSPYLTINKPVYTQHFIKEASEVRKKGDIVHNRNWLLS
jgi:hypothetical protein